MKMSDGFRKWFEYPERPVLFVLGLIYSSCMMKYIMSIFMTFLTEVWNLKLKRASIIINVQLGLKKILEIFSGFLIDSCLGDRWMLILSSIINVVGLVVLSRSVPGEEPCSDPEVICYAKLKASPFFIGLALIIVGGAAQGIPLYTLSFEQLKLKPKPKDQSKIKTRKRACFKLKRPKFKKVIKFLCYTFMLAGTLTGIFGFPSSINWSPEFMASAIAMVVGLLLFLCGIPIYPRPQLQPSPLSTMVRVLAAAMRKRHLNYQENTMRLYYGDEHGQTLTNRLRCLNKAAIQALTDDPIVEVRSWRLCTVKEIEHTKTLLGMIPMAVTFIIYGMVKSVADTYFIEQANQMDGTLNFGAIDITGIPIAILQFVSEIASFLVKWLYKRILEKRINESKKRYSDGMKIGLGMLASTICCTVASCVEAKRLKILWEKNLSAFWLLPQFFFMGAMDGLARDGIQDFFGHNVPYSMRRYGPIFTNVLIGYGIILIIVFEAMLDQYNKFKGRASWIGDSINESHMDYFYRALAAMTIVNLFIYAYIATRYSYKNLEGVAEKEEEELVVPVAKEEEEAAAAEGEGKGKEVPRNENYELSKISVRN